MGKSSRWDRYLGMTAAMTQVPVPVTKVILSHLSKSKHLIFTCSMFSS